MMTKMTRVKKIALYERILKYLTGATEIRVRNLSRDGDYGFVELVDAGPEDVKCHGVDEGLYFGYCSEAYMEDYGGAIKPRKDTRIIVEVWFGVDPWAEIKRLEEQIQSLQGSEKNES